MIRSTPPLTLATLALAAGLLLSLRFPPTGPGLLLATAALVAVAVTRRDRLTPAIGAILSFTLAGSCLGYLAIGATAEDCRTRLPDGALVEVRGAVETLPTAGRVSLHLRQVSVGEQTVACRGSVRARLPRHMSRRTPTSEDQRDARPRTAAAPRAGTDVVGWGRWWITPGSGGWPRRADRHGTLSLDSLRAAPLDVRARHPLLAARAGAQQRLRTLLPERAPLAEALLLAQRDGIDQTVREPFVRSGLTHFLAISGLHVGLIAAGLLLVARLFRLALRPAMIVAGAVTAVYVLFIGAPHAAARASLQLLLLLTARLTQRPSNPFALLAAAALPLLLLDPLAVLDAGFQLSFAGTAGILALRRRLLRLFPGHRLGRYVWDALATSIAATIATAPIVALHFGRIAPIGILAGLPALPLVALAVPALALALGLSLVSWPAAHFLAGAGDVLLAALEAIAGLAARLPTGHVYVPRDAVFAWFGAAGIATLAAARLGRLRPAVRRLAAVGCAVAFLVGWPVLAARIGTGSLEIHAIDVGQGDAFALRSPRGRWLLVDAGPVSDGFDAGRARVVPFLLQRGVRRLDAIILTHPHADHIGGLGAVWEAFDVSAIFDPGLAAGSQLYSSLLREAADRGNLWFAARAGRELDFDGVTIDFIYPEDPEDGMLDVGDDANEVSVVFRMMYGDFAALFTGDVDASIEESLVAEHGEGLRSHLLKVAHHGSASSTSEALLAATKPSAALISMGRRNIYGHPAPSVLDRLEMHGIEVWRTDQHGAVSVTVDAQGDVDVRSERTPE